MKINENFHQGGGPQNKTLLWGVDGLWILSGTTDYNSEKIFKNIILKNAVSQKNCYTFLQIELRK